MRGHCVWALVICRVIVICGHSHLWMGSHHCSLWGFFVILPWVVVICGGSSSSVGDFCHCGGFLLSMGSCLPWPVIVHLWAVVVHVWGMVVVGCGWWWWCSGGVVVGSCGPWCLSSGKLLLMWHTWMGVPHQWFCCAVCWAPLPLASPSLASIIAVVIFSIVIVISIIDISRCELVCGGGGGGGGGGGE